MELKLLISSSMRYAYSRYKLISFDSRILRETLMHNTSDAIMMQSIERNSMISVQYQILS